MFVKNFYTMNMKQLNIKKLLSQFPQAAVGFSQANPSNKIIPYSL